MQEGRARFFTRGYVLYLLCFALLATVLGKYILDARRSLTIEDMMRDDFQNVEGRILRKIDRDGLLYDLAPNVTKLHDGVEYATNNDGMRDDRDYPVARTQGYKRLIFLGDSFTFGWGLKLEYSFVKQLEALLNEWSDFPYEWEVLNFGAPGYNTILEVNLFEMKARKYEPDVVILMYHLNDAESARATPLGDHRETRSRLLNYFGGDASGPEEERVRDYLEGQGYPTRLPPIPARPRAIGERTVALFVTHYLPLYWDPLKERLDRLETLAETHGFDVIVGILPEIHLHPTETWADYRFDSLHERIGAEMRRHGFYVIDLKPILSHYPYQELMLKPGKDGHTNAFANRLIAHALAAHLEKLYK